MPRKKKRPPIDRKSLCREGVESFDFIEATARALIQKCGAVTSFDDLVQEGVIGHLEARERYIEGGKASFKTFAHKRIRGSVIDHMRSRFPSPKNGDCPGIVLECIDEHPEIKNRSNGEGPIDDIIRDERRAIILAALETLKPRDRLVVCFRYYGDMSIKDIAEFFDISVTAISLRLKVIRGRMEKSIGTGEDI
jgi:RNA polymerase sigma factor (sigma-70 family)